MYVLLVLSCMWWHTVYRTSLYSMINVARGPKGHTDYSTNRCKSFFLKPLLLFNIFSLLCVSQDLDHLGLKACKATFKDH